MQQKFTVIKNQCHVTYWAWNRVRIKLLLLWTWELCRTPRKSTRVRQLRSCHLRTIACCRVTNDNSFKVFKLRYQFLTSTFATQFIHAQLKQLLPPFCFQQVKDMDYFGSCSLCFKGKHKTRCNNYGSKVLRYMSSRMVSRDYYSYSNQATTLVRISPLASVNANRSSQLFSCQNNCFTYVS